jgi:hypothetical protein
MENTTQEKPFKVIELVKFGMLFGYGVKEIESGKIIFEFDELEKHLAESKCDLKNALKGF